MSGFDDIIKDLDGWLERPQAPVPPPRPDAPRFNIGDQIVIRETAWNGRVLQRTGLYSNPGFPNLQDLDMPVAELEWQFNAPLHGKLQENLIGTVEIGDKCRILAVWFGEHDKRWYYFIDNGKPKGKGWTRCDFRFAEAK